MTYHYPQTDRAWLSRWVPWLTALVIVFFVLTPFLLPFNVLVAITVVHLLNKK
jgi:hypothetical protein